MTASRIWIKNPLALYTANDQKAPGGLVIERGVIVEMLDAGQSPSTPVDSTFDAREHVVLPGLINTHHHFYQTLTRAWGPVVNQPLFPWLKTLYPVWARLTPDRLALASKVALAELLLSGCTTAADHHYLFPDGLENAIDMQIDVVRELGMRAMLTRGSMSLGEADGGLPPQHTVQTAEAILEDSERLIGRYHERGAGAQIQIGLAPCFTRQLLRPLRVLCALSQLGTYPAETSVPLDPAASARESVPPSASFSACECSLTSLWIVCSTSRAAVSNSVRILRSSSSSNYANGLA